MSGKDRTYKATAAELNTEIETVLKDKPGAEWKEVRKILMKNKKTWKLPERRVAKFVKRQKMGQPISEDDENSVVNSVGSGSLRRFFSSKKVVKSSETEATKEGDEPPAEEEKEVAEEEPAPEPVEEEKSREVDIPAEATDDNDGKKEPGICAGCVIL